MPPPHNELVPEERTHVPEVRPQGALSKILPYNYQSG